MPVEHVAPCVTRLRKTDDVAGGTAAEQSGDSGADRIHVNRVRRQPAVKRQTELRIARELDDLARSRDAGAVDMAEADDRALDAPASCAVTRIPFDVELGAPVLARRMRMPPFVFGIAGGRNELAVDGDRAEVHEPLQRPGLQQAVHQRAVARVRLTGNTAGRFERAVDDDVAVVEDVWLAGR